jgi:hypothetical protein
MISSVLNQLTRTTVTSTRRVVRIWIMAFSRRPFGAMKFRVSPLARSKEANGQERGNAYTHLWPYCLRDTSNTSPRIDTLFDSTVSEPSTHSSIVHISLLHFHQHLSSPNLLNDDRFHHLKIYPNHHVARTRRSCPSPNRSICQTPTPQCLWQPSFG